MILCSVGDDESEDEGEDRSEDESEDEREDEREDKSEDEREDKSEDGRADGEDEAKTNFATVEKYIKKHGEVDLPSLKSYLIGPPGVGKTTTLKRLTREFDHLPVNEELSPSTGMDAPVTVFITDVLIDEQWKSQRLEEQCQTLCSCILKICGEDNTVQQTANNVQENSNKLPIPPASTELSPVVMKSHPVEATNSVKNEHFVPTSSAAEISESTFDESPSPSDHSIVSSQSRSDHKEYEITSALRSLVEEKDWKRIGKILKSEKFTLLQIIDIGGQPEFHEIIPLLLHGLAIYLIFLDMSISRHEL